MGKPIEGLDGIKPSTLNRFVNIDKASNSFIFVASNPLFVLEDAIFIMYS